MQIEIPNLLIGNIDFIIETIELVIDTSNPNGIAHNFPLLTDMEESFMINKNIERGIILFAEDFHIDEEPQYLEIGSDINLDTFTLSLWAVEDVTEASSKRLFIPLEHAIISRVVDENGKFVSLRFHFKEMEWFEDFNFKTGFNFLKLLLFTENAKKNRCKV
jgi:hypothetical protein